MANSFGFQAGKREMPRHMYSWVHKHGDFYFLFLSFFLTKCFILRVEIYVYLPRASMGLHLFFKEILLSFVLPYLAFVSYLLPSFVVVISLLVLLFLL